MKPFLNKDFLLDTPCAQHLFHDYAEKAPIFDWHCHLSAKEIFENRQPADIYELWLTGDHYKWRAMRSAGVPERLVTGDGAPQEKFRAFAKTLSLAAGNPLVHWSHLELQRYFGIDTFLSEKTADEIWAQTKAKIASEDFRPQTLIRNSNVFALCTTDDPADSLEWHVKLRDSDFEVPVLPAFRPDKAIAVENVGFAAWVEALSACVGYSVTDYASLQKALEERIVFFKSLGCVASDQSVACLVPVPTNEAQWNATFQKALRGEALTKMEIDAYHYATLQMLGKLYFKHDLAMELHLGAMRNNNTRRFLALGPDTGFDSIDDPQQAQGLSRLLDSLDREGVLPRTILFTLNPKDNYVLGTMLGNFQSDEAKSKIQFGSAWWFNDHIDGMTLQMKTLANLGVLGCFVGMVTDSRSFLSYPRHEYFRRILCGILGRWVEEGLFPNDDELLKTIVEGVSFNNAKTYFLK